jgi:hypothetical protein
MLIQKKSRKDTHQYRSFEKITSNPRTFILHDVVRIVARLLKSHMYCLSFVLCTILLIYYLIVNKTSVVEKRRHAHLFRKKTLPIIKSVL